MTVSPCATRGTVFDSVIVSPSPLARAILTVTLTLNSSFSPWLANTTVNSDPAV